MIESSKRHGTFAAVVALTGALLVVPALAQTPSAPPPTPPTAAPAAPSAMPAAPSTAPATKAAPTKTSKRLSGV